jgi:hypothetical protein
VAVQVLGLVARAGRLLVWSGLVKDHQYAAALDQSLRTYYRDEWRRLTLSVFFHALGGAASILETLVILWVLGITTSLALATVIEAVGSAVRFATFLVPASIGALEGANAGAFAALGLGAGAGLAFSLMRRARQVVWIVLGLAVLVGMRAMDARRSPASDDAAQRVA